MWDRGADRLGELTLDRCDSDRDYFGFGLSERLFASLGH